jgi:hypothetical protein
MAESGKIVKHYLLGACLFRQSDFFFTTINTGGVIIMTSNQKIWLREEIRIAEDLLSYAPKLTEDFLNYHQDFINGNFSKALLNDDTSCNASDPIIQMDRWKKEAIGTEHHKADGIKYTRPGVHIDLTNDERTINKFPTAVALTKKYNDVCAISTYSIIEPNSIVERHIDPENLTSRCVRIHIPLLIPKGDIFLECEGIEINWSDLFAFDNKLPHSAYNYSNYRRLIYIIDITREFLNILPGEPFDVMREETIPKFVRGKIPNILHRVQR